MALPARPGQTKVQNDLDVFKKSRLAKHEPITCFSGIHKKINHSCNPSEWSLNLSVTITSTFPPSSTKFRKFFSPMQSEAVKVNLVIALFLD